MTDAMTTNDVNLPLHNALERTRPELAARGETDLPPITLDIQTATAAARGAIPNILLLRLQLETEVPKFDITLLDKLETYAQTLLQAEANYRVTTAPPEVLAGLGEEGTKLRALLLSDATALINRGLLNSGSLDHLKGPNGYRNLGSDILSISTLLRNNWSTISTKTCVAVAELDRAEVVADQLNESYGIREHSPAKIAALALERHQAYALFVEAYDQVRRAVSYLRWDKGDVDTIAPSLYTAGRSAPRKKGSTDTEEAVPPVVSAPAASGVVTHAVSESAAPAKVAIGMPGADPFAG